MKIQVPTAILDTEVRIRTKVRMVAADEQQFARLSRREQLAVAMVLNRHDLLEQACSPTILESIERLGLIWTEAALRVQRLGWEDDLPF